MSTEGPSLDMQPSGLSPKPKKSPKISFLAFYLADFLDYKAVGLFNSSGYALLTFRRPPEVESLLREPAPAVFCAVNLGDAFFSVWFLGIPGDGASEDLY